MYSSGTRETLILRLSNQHDDVAWEQFAEIYKGYIFTVVTRMGISINDAEDITQDILITLWKKLPDFDYQPDKCKFRTWMNVVTSNKVKNFYRKSSNYSKMVSNQDEESPDSTPEIYDIMETNWKIHITKMALDSISKSFSGKAIECFKLWSENVPPEEISKRLDIKLNSVYVFRKRVLEKLSLEVRRLDSEIS